MSDRSQSAILRQSEKRRTSPALFRHAFDTAPVPMLCLDRDFHLQTMNAKCADLLAVDSAVEGKPWFEVINTPDRLEFQHWLESIADTSSEFKFRLRRPGEEGSTMVAHASRWTDELGEPAGCMLTLIRATQSSSAKSFLEAENQLLEAIARGIPIREGLERLVRFIEEQSSDVIASVLLFDESRQCLLLGAAAQLSAEYNRACDGLAIGERVGSCGTAAWRKQAVIVEDIETDPLWADYRQFARNENVRACWSTPIFDTRGSLLGTFAIYRRIPGGPTAAHKELIETATNLASMMLARDRDRRQLLASQEQLRMMKFSVDLCSTSVFWLRQDASFFYVNDAAVEKFGYPRDEILKMAVHDIDPNYPRDVWPEFWQQMRKERSKSFESSIRTSSGTLIPVEITTNFLEYEGQEFVFAFVNDVSQRKDLYENSPHMMTSMDIETGLMLQCNETMARTLGRSKRELIGTRTFDLLTPRSRKRIESEVFPRFLATGRVDDEPIELICADGSVRDFIFSSTAVLDENGKIRASRSVMRDVTEQKRTESKLAESEARLRAIIESEPECVKLVGPNGELLDMNSAGLEMIEADSLDQVRNQCIFNVISEDHREAFQQMHYRVMEGETAQLEFTIDGLRGTRRWMETNASPLRAPSGEIIAHLAVTRDITERKKAEQALLHSEALFRTLVQTAPFGVQRNDIYGRITFANDALGRIYGCPPEMLVGFSVLDFAIDEEMRHEIRQHVREQIENPKSSPSPFETVNRTMDGRVIDINVDWTYDRDAEGEIVGFIVIITDITERKRAERELEFRADVLDRVSDAVVVTDSKGNINYANEAAHRLYRVEKVENRTVELAERHRQLLEAARFDEGVRAGLGEIGVWQGEHELTIENEHFWMETKLKTFPSPSGGPKLLLAVIRDISSRRLAEQENRQHRDVLAHFARLSTMGALVAGIAHEVKQPLYAIANYSTAVSVALNMLEEKLGHRVDQIDGLMECNNGIRDSSQRANEIISRLRDFARRGTQDRKPVDLNQVVIDSVNLLSFKARDGNVTVNLELADTLPTVIADRIQCEQVVVNLLNNAYEALNDIRGERHVTIETQVCDRAVVLQVYDNGPGLPEAEPGRLFEAFYTTKADGMGMGLAISQTIIEDHGGRLSVENRPEGGALSQVTLPVHDLP